MIVPGDDDSDVVAGTRVFIWSRHPDLNWGPADYEVVGHRAIKLGTPPCLKSILCAACGSAMKIVSVIREHNVIDAILRHLARTGGRDPFEGRAPPAA